EMYELRNVTKTYRKGRATVTALRDVDLSIDEGEFLAIQGPTGQGKSTLLQLLGALDRPTSGSVVFEDRDLATMREGELTDLRSPRVILADEPSGNLDEGTRDEIIGLLERLWADRGQTLVIVTHDSWIAGRAPRSAWIYEGRLSIRQPSEAIDS